MSGLKPPIVTYNYYTKQDKLYNLNKVQGAVENKSLQLLDSLQLAGVSFGEQACAEYSSQVSKLC